MHLKKISLLIFLSTVYTVSIAQTTPDNLLKKFFTEYSKQPSVAVENLYLSNPWAARTKDAIEQMKNEVNRYTIDYVGPYYGNELITKKQFSESLVLYSYLLKYERQPLRFIFKFYKPNDKWLLYSLKIDGDVDDELEQSARLYYLDLENQKP